MIWGHCSAVRKVFLDAFRDEAGSELVEFAFSVCILLMCIFGVIYVSLAAYADHYVVNAARAGARYAMVRGSSWGGASCSATSGYSCTATSANVASYVEDALAPGLAKENVTVETTWPGITATGATCDTTDGVNSPYCVVKVQVSYSFALSLPLVPQKALLFTSASIIPISE